MNELEKYINADVFVYAKDNRYKKFNAFNFKHGIVFNLFWCSVVKDTPKIREVLQSVANEGKHLGIQFQLRDRTKQRKVIWQTS